MTRGRRGRPALRAAAGGVHRGAERPGQAARRRVGQAVEEADGPGVDGEPARANARGRRPPPTARGRAARAGAEEGRRGRRPQAFERARGAERDALRRLRSQAADLLRAGGHPANDSTLERVASTLRAGSATEEGRALLREGRLSEELEPQGFGALVGVKPAAPRARKKPQTRAVRARPARTPTPRPPQPKPSRRAHATRSARPTAAPRRQARGRQGRASASQGRRLEQ